MTCIAPTQSYDFGLLKSDTGVIVRPPVDAVVTNQTDVFPKTGDLWRMVPISQILSK